MGPNKLYYKDNYKDFPGSTSMLMRVIINNSGYCNSMEGQTVVCHVHTLHKQTPTHTTHVHTYVHT